MHLANQTRSTPFFAPHAKWAFTTRRVPQAVAQRLSRDIDAVRPGDLVLAEVTKVGNHRRVQLADGRFSALYPGDQLVLACADRFAPDQFSGIARLGAEGADLLAGGGVIGELTDRNAKASAPTKLVPFGILEDAAGRVLNVADFAMHPGGSARPALSFLVVGTGMNAGKTTAAAGLVNGFARLGSRPTAVKLTGTGSFGDLQAYEAAGASAVLDFTDTGMASTHRQPIEKLLKATDTLLDAASASDVAIFELADGIAQSETVELLKTGGFADRFDAVVLAAADPLSAQAALQMLGSWGIVPTALSGRITASPSDAREAARSVGLPVLSREELADPATANALQLALAAQTAAAA